MNRIPPFAHVRVVVAAIVAVTAAAACLASCAEVLPATPAATPSGTTNGSSIRLHLLVGVPGAMRFVTVSVDDHAAATTVPDALGVPDSTASTGDIRWASGDLASGFLVTVGTRGRLYTSEPSPAGSRPTWREIVPGDTAAGRLGLTFGVLSPDGLRLAALAGNPASGVADARLVVIDRATGSTRVISLDGIVDGRPPVWIGPGHVAIPIRDRSDEHVVAVVDMATASVETQPAAGGCIAASADGSAVVSTDPGAIGAISTASGWSFLAGSRADELPLDIGAGRIAAQVLLDHTGSILGVAWLTEDGDAAAVGVYRRAGSVWALVTEVTLPIESTRAILVGFDP